MRVYKFLNQQYGLKSLYERRLRRTRISELNDPFELRPYDLTNPEHRQAFLKAKKDLAQRFGLLCFSAAWDDPVIWAHYSDKHRGLCLGFEIPPKVEKEETQRVEYIANPLPFPADFFEQDDDSHLVIVNKMIFTKYRFWEYEREIRTWTDLEEEFFDFGEVLHLAEVIIGAECPLPTEEVKRALGSVGDSVNVKKARAAHSTFRIVEDESAH